MPGHSYRANASSSSNPDLSYSEKQWLKENWGGEFKFLRAYGLSIHKEEDREEGRLILRAMMEAAGEN